MILGGGNAKLHLALAGLHILERIEAREVLADNFVGAIPLDALRTNVPRRDMSARIEHEDRVVAHALDDVAIALLGFELGTPRDPERRAAMGRANREKAAREYEIDAVFSRFDAIWRELLEAPRADARAEAARPERA